MSEINLYSMFKKVVFDWLDVISKGTNKDVVKELLTPKGVAYTFDLPMGLSKKLFNKWKLKN